MELNPKMKLCLSQLESVTLSGRDFSFAINSAQSTKCYSIVPSADFQLSQFSKENNFTIDFHKYRSMLYIVYCVYHSFEYKNSISIALYMLCSRVNWITISFALKTVQPNPAEYAKLPDCYSLNCTVCFHF